ncbi:MAG: hypothetical protein LBS60_14100 [Deltaproteobacteria bacterium]|jgi:hypothetical protein|nr:hypothetical protein [Deltaproteobacteria bacterium]
MMTENEKKSLMIAGAILVVILILLATAGLRFWVVIIGVGLVFAATRYTSVVEDLRSLWLKYIPKDGKTSTDQSSTPDNGPQKISLEKDNSAPPSGDPSGAGGSSGPQDGQPKPETRLKKIINAVGSIIVVGAVIFWLFSSSGKCDSSNTKELLIDMIKTKLLTRVLTADQANSIQVSLGSIKTLDEDKKLKLCECKAQVNLTNKKLDVDIDSSIVYNVTSKSNEILIEIEGEEIAKFLLTAS